ncbi:MAG: hypothetical protein RLY31_2521 [Bacteroidota bacterium]
MKMISSPPFWRPLLCTFLLAGVLSTVSAQLSVSLVPQHPACGGFSTGSVQAVPSGGSAPYSFTWNTGATANPLTNLPAGTYSVTVTSAGGLTAAAAVTLTAPPTLEAAITVTDCNLPGAMVVTPSGGTPPYSFLWNNGATSATISNLQPGIFCVNILDFNNCGVSDCETIAQPLSLQVITTPVLCDPSSLGGTAFTNMSGGNPPFTYLWSTGSSNSSINGLPTGTYSVTATAGNGCSATGSGVVGFVPGDLSISLQPTHPLCTGNANGSITATPANGSLPFAFLWNTGQTSPTIQNLPQGSYSVTVTDGLGCTAAESVTLTNQSNLSLTLDYTNPSCNGLNNGAVSALPTNGIPPYSFTWSNGQTTANLSGLPPGSYSVTVTDQLQCKRNASALLTVIPPFPLQLSADSASQCGLSDGNVSTWVSPAAQQPLSFLWNTGDTSAQLTNVPAGSYSVTVTSAIGCSNSATATVGQPAEFSVLFSGATAICAGQSSGELVAAPQGGVPPLSFLWSTGSNEPFVTNLPPGSYSVTVSSSDGCTGSSSANMVFAPEIDLVVTPVPIACFGDSTGLAAAAATGGIPPFSFAWSNGDTLPTATGLWSGNFSLTVTDAGGCTSSQIISVTQSSPLTLTVESASGSCDSLTGFASAFPDGGNYPYAFLWNNGQANAHIQQLPPGIFSVTVTDTTGCTVSDSVSIAAFPTLSLSLNATNTTCNGIENGTLSAQTTGGLPPFSFQWNAGPTDPVVENVAPGLYFVTVTDGNGCTRSDSISVLLGTGLVVSLDGPTYACPGVSDSLAAAAGGGTEPYTFTWSNGGTGPVLHDVFPGSYTVNVTDPNGCFGTAQTNILAGGNFAVEADLQHLACFGDSNGQISLTVLGGLPPFSFLWENGDTTFEIGSLPQGDFSVTVTESSSCRTAASFQLIAPPPLSLSADQYNGSCLENGTIGVQATGGTPPYTYLWSTGANGQFVFDLAPDSYQLSLTDANQCQRVDTFLITPIPVPSCSVLPLQQVSGTNLNDGALTVSVQGGTEPFSFAWNTGDASDTIDQLWPGTYMVTVTDPNSCSAVCTFTLLQPATLGDFVWLDTDMDGRQSNTETGLPNVSVLLTGSDILGNTVSDTTYTQADGSYRFAPLPGTYQLSFIAPTGLSHSPNLQGDDNDLDSDVHPLTGKTPQLTMAEGTIRTDIDAGFFPSLPCDPLTDAGTVCCDQTLCGPAPPSSPITSISPPDGGSGAIEFTWMRSTGEGPFDPDTWSLIPDAFDDSLLPTLPMTQTTQLVRLARRSNCTAFLPSNIIRIEVDSQSFAHILPGPDTVCLGLPVVFEALAFAPDASYAWSFQDGSPAEASIRTVDGVAWDTPGKKTVRLDVTTGTCTSTDMTFVLVSNEPAYCGDALVIQAASDETTGAVTVDWYYRKPDTLDHTFSVHWGTDPSDLTPIASPITETDLGDVIRYETVHPGPVRGTNHYQVRLSREGFVPIRSNIASVYYAGDYRYVHIYPNPFQDRLVVEVIDRFDGLPITLVMTTADGRLVRTFSIPPEGERVEFPLGEIPAGAYFLRVNYDGKIQKIVKMMKTD